MMDFSRLNGWQRLWLVLSIIWFALVALLFLYSRNITFVLAFLTWAIPTGLLYAGGLAIKWILAGFFSKGKR
jgi:hypothetical protein